MDKQSAEEIATFFNTRADVYDQRHLSMIDGGMDSKRLGPFLPEAAERILDLGAGTGLELISIFERFPDVEVDVIDLAESMLERLVERFPGKQIRVASGSYFSMPFEAGSYDAVVSSMTMHHWTAEEKKPLFKKICGALKPGGMYLYNDYMLTGDTENAFEAEQLALLEDRNNMLSEESLHIHVDIPPTTSKEMELLWKSGFSRVEELWRSGTNVTLGAWRR